MLFTFARNRKELPFRKLFWLFGLFIVSCGITHLLDAVTFLHPLYRILGLAKVLTALASWGTVLALIPVIPKFYSMRLPEELEAEIAERTSESRRQTAMLRAILENMGEGIVMVDQRGSFLEVNSAAKRLLPSLIDPPEDLNDWSHHFGITDEANRPLETSELPLARALQGEFIKGAMISVPSEEQRRWLRVTASPLPGTEGGAVAVFADVTEMKKSLEEVEEARRMADKASRAKSEFLAVMSHELRTPLNGAKGMLEMLEGTKLDADQKEYAQTAAVCADALLSLIDDILDFSKIEAGELELKRDIFSISELLETLRAIFSDKPSETLTFVIQTSPNTPTQVFGDRRRVLQVLVNLIANAVKYSGSGEIRLIIDATASDELEFRVSDQGPGIPPKLQEKIFEPFAQGESSSVSGVGLGLSIVNQLVGLMQGALTLESSTGTGSVFVVRLPLPHRELQQRSEQAATVQDLSFLQVLVVEDNPINRRVVSLQLAKLGIVETLQAPDGFAALTLLEKERPDLILLDYQMPGMNGVEVARQIREQPDRYGHPRIIALTAHALEQERKKCFEVGMDDFLTKPLAFEELSKALHRWAATLRG